MKEVVFSLDSFVLIQVGILIAGIFIGIYSLHKILHY